MGKLLPGCGNTLRALIKGAFNFQAIVAFGVLSVHIISSLSLTILNLVAVRSNIHNLDLLDLSRDNIILALQDNEKEYLTNYYQPKEPSFCRAYTSKFPNLGCHSTQRNEKIHDVVTVGLSKNIPVGKAIEIICDRIKRLPKWYDDQINKDRLTLPRLLNKVFLSSIVIDLHIIA